VELTFRAAVGLWNPNPRFIYQLSVEPSINSICVSGRYVSGRYVSGRSSVAVW
jgi:hypothetical protein